MFVEYIMTYSNVIYKLNKRYKHGKNIYHEGPIPFPDKLSFNDIISLITRGQAVCFKDGDVDNTNSDRIYDSFDRYANEQPSVAVIFSLGYLTDESSLMSANDMGALTIQLGELNIMTGEQLQSRERGLWINEVCRSLFNKEAVPRTAGPVPNVMKLAEEYAKLSKHKNIYLMVEKHPEHGDGNVLLQYYSDGYKGRGGYGYTVIAEDNEYWYMKKSLSKTPEREDVIVVIRETSEVDESSVPEPEDVITTPTTPEGETLLANLKESLAEAGAVKKHKKRSKTRKRGGAIKKCESLPQASRRIRRMRRRTAPASASVPASVPAPGAAMEDVEMGAPVSSRTRASIKRKRRGGKKTRKHK